MSENENRLNKPHLSFLTFLGFQLNSAIESGAGEKVSFTDIYKGVEWGTLIEDLDKKLPGVIDFGLFQSQERRAALYTALKYSAGGMKGRETKYGVQKNGLSLLMAFVLETIQHPECWIS